MHEDDTIKLYKTHAQTWVNARLRESTLYEKLWLDRFRAAISEGASVLDCGCGSGEPIARYLVEQGCQVTGVDSSPEMIAMFHAKLPSQKAIVADMRNLSLGTRFDGLLAWDSFFHLGHESQRRFLPTVRRHLKPGGAFLFTSGTSHGEALGELEGELLYHASLASTEYRALLDAEGFEVIAHTKADPECRNRTVWLARQKLQ